MSSFVQDLSDCIKKHFPSVSATFSPGIFNDLAGAVHDFMHTVYESSDGPLSPGTKAVAREALDALARGCPADESCKHEPCTSPCAKPCPSCSAKAYPDFSKYSCAKRHGCNPEACYNLATGECYPEHCKDYCPECNPRPRPGRTSRPLHCATCEESSPSGTESSVDRAVHVFHTATNIIRGERNVAYGDPEDSFTLIAEFWNAYVETAHGHSSKLSRKDVAMMLALLKIAREANGPKRDNLVDGAAYLALAYGVTRPKTS